VTGKRRRGRDPLPTPRASQQPASSTPGAPVRPPQPARPVDPTPFVVTRTPTRRELRAQRRRQRRRRLGAAGVAAIIVGAIILGTLIGFGVHKVTEHSSGPKRTQATVLMSIVGADRTALDSALLAHDTGTKRGLELLLPSRVITEVCGFGSQQLGQVIRLPGGEQLSREAVSSMLGGVAVDGSWTLTTGDLARLVDRLGGITVDVDTNVIIKVKGRRILEVPRGVQKLAGSRAALYATYIAAGEDSTGNLPRLQAVIDAIAKALPTAPGAAARVLGSSGPAVASTLGANRLANLLLGLAADNVANTVLPSDLPVVKIDSGGAATYRIDAAGTRTLVSSNLAGSLPTSSKGPRGRILIQNGVGTPGLDGSACRRLVAAGYTVVGSGNADSFNFATSKVLVFSSSVAAARLGNDVAHVLKLSDNDVAVSNQAQNVADVIVILGRDYRR